MLYNQTGLYEEALYYSTLAQQQSSNDRDACAAKQLMIESYYRLQHAENMDEIYSTAVASCQQAGAPVFESLVHYFYIRYLLDIEELQGAARMVDEHYQAAQQLSYEPLRVFYQALKAQVYLLMDDFASAEEAALIVTANPDNHQYFETHVIASKTLYQVYEQKGDFKSALHYHKLLHQSKLQYRDLQSERIRGFYESKAVMEAKTQQIELLNMENSLLYLQQQVLSKEAQNARLLLGLFVLMLLALGFLAYQGLIGRHRFKFMAENDELTGISNRYHFNKLAEKSLLHCKKQGMTVGVILFDLDHFKQINDKFGHATGDWVLQQVVQSCRNFMRLDDIFGRLGGEEFAIVLPGCHADKALMLAEICRDSIEDIDTKRCGHEFLLTASFGVTSSDTSGYELKQLLADADKAMYRAKQGGRNQVHFFTGTPAVKSQPQFGD
ncbi:GGDEF domain-containing protein [Alkalimonas sp.]|uniref:GGDEF domain-containing protein n=1 Tax=Alkalimonas sp. TaxID=1872453 RepID=UPI00263B26AE|nr:GGDEF domain-containing protein [Alkalimonas sp.]MCC5825742.1 GGDEF domain-containing protein [Alkalimonas sp.]